MTALIRSSFALDAEFGTIFKDQRQKPILPPHFDDPLLDKVAQKYGTAILLFTFLMSVCGSVSIDVLITAFKCKRSVATLG